MHTAIPIVYIRPGVMASLLYKATRGDDGENAISDTFKTPPIQSYCGTAVSLRVLFMSARR